ncbi:unnamed protein product [Cylindrotheca closterium]|uniref:Uncharacterized protein n=1 Tax=Cylindrotheca closterium TaxID=2856 RepID=A0AAD2CTY5_9STRA|nr:unnamed protein product [Cylindrotheca closterium]
MMRFHDAYNNFILVVALLGLILQLQLDGVKAFAPRSEQSFLRPTLSTTTIRTIALQQQQQQQQQPRNPSSSSALNCICINCKYVTSCKAYHFVEEKHQQPHMTEDPTFEPRNGSPTIHVNVRIIRSSDDVKSEYERMYKEHEHETKKAEAEAGGGGDDKNAPLHGSAKYDLSPVTTYEYDVVKCEDYVEDMGCWVRNMPQEIKEANPDFVPT